MKNANIFRNGTGKIIRSIGMIQDITELKKAEETLQESEEKYRRIVENTTNVIMGPNLMVSSPI